MKFSKPVLAGSLIIYIVMQLTACGTTTRVSISTTTPWPSFTPITSTTTPFMTPTNTATHTTTPTITFTSTPDFCVFEDDQQKLQVMSPDLITALELGGAPLYDSILVARNPAWADFRQYQSGELRSAGVIFHETAFGPPIPELGAGINPAVLLVTYGVDKDWKLPANGDLVAEVDYIRAVLHQRRNYWVLGIIDRSQTPMIEDAGTYALYYYFGGDLSRLEEWCHTYVHVYGKSPLE